jgi:hypothetical protein
MRRLMLMEQGLLISETSLDFNELYIHQACTISSATYSPRAKAAPF